jgi:hypothetical protein
LKPGQLLALARDRVTQVDDVEDFWAADVGDPDNTHMGEARPGVCSDPPNTPERAHIMPG